MENPKEWIKEQLKNIQNELSEERFVIMNKIYDTLEEKMIRHEIKILIDEVIFENITELMKTLNQNIKELHDDL